jgi:hypothetical protein
MLILYIEDQAASAALSFLRQGFAAYIVRLGHRTFPSSAMTLW